MQWLNHTCHFYFHNRVRKNAPIIWKRGSANLVWLVNSIILLLAHHCRLLHLNFINRCNLLRFLCLTNTGEHPQAWEWLGLLCWLVRTFKGLMVLYFFLQELFHFLDGVLIRWDKNTVLESYLFWLFLSSYLMVVPLNWSRHLLVLCYLLVLNLLLGLLLYMEWPNCLHQHQLLLGHILHCPLLLAPQAVVRRRKFFLNVLANLNANTILKQGTVNLDRLVDMIIHGIGVWHDHFSAPLVFLFVR